jgi:dihydrofolate reductase
MRTITVVNNLTLDGVMQSPARKDEDPSGGFEHGGWAADYDDEVKGREMGKGMAKKGALLLGRRTYQHFYKVWHGRTDNPFTPVLERSQKYVVSRTLKEPLPWQNSTLLEGDGAETVAELKRQSDLDLTILGSGELVRSLAARDLIDEYILLIHPLLLGRGRRTFDDSSAFAKFDLVESVPTTKGVIIATYRRARA